MPCVTVFRPPRFHGFCYFISIFYAMLVLFHLFFIYKFKVCVTVVVFASLVHKNNSRKIPKELYLGVQLGLLPSTALWACISLHFIFCNLVTHIDNFIQFPIRPRWARYPSAICQISPTSVTGQSIHSHRLVLFTSRQLPSSSPDIKPVFMRQSKTP